MAIEKSYAIAEIKKIFSDAADFARTLPPQTNDDEYYNEMAKHVFEPLKVVFQLLLEPAFNEEVLPQKSQADLFDSVGLMDSYEKEIEELKADLDVKKNNEKLLLEANNKLAETYKESLAGKDDIIELLKDLVVKLAAK